jgi:hypothetical protein
MNEVQMKFRELAEKYIKLNTITREAWHEMNKTENVWQHYNAKLGIIERQLREFVRTNVRTRSVVINGKIFIVNYTKLYTQIIICNEDGEEINE